MLGFRRREVYRVQSGSVSPPGRLEESNNNLNFVSADERV
jgi:hypothetical protein